MVNLLIQVILSSFAVVLCLEALEVMLDGFFRKSTINKYLVLPLSLGFLLVFIREWELLLVVVVPATAFLSLAIDMFINKPTVVQTNRLPRIL